jgi:hypothetical protein
MMTTLRTAAQAKKDAAQARKLAQATAEPGRLAAQADHHAQAEAEVMHWWEVIPDLVADAVAAGKGAVVISDVVTQDYDDHEEMQMAMQIIKPELKKLGYQIDRDGYYDKTLDGNNYHYRVFLIWDIEAGL